MDWTQIKAYLIRNIEPKFRAEGITYPCTFEQGIDLFHHFLMYKSNNQADTDIETAIHDALFSLSQDTQVNNFCVLEIRLEKFLGKILAIVNLTKFQELENSNSPSLLLPYIKALNLNKKSLYFEEFKIKQLEGQGEFAEYLCSAYVFRNQEAHKSEAMKWSDDILRRRTVAVIVTYLFAVFENYRKLKITVLPNDLTDYLKNQIQNYKEWSKKNAVGFVHIDGLEYLTPMDLLATENIDFEDEKTENEQDNEENFDAEIVQKREGTIDFLRKNKVKERKMVVRGDLGMGKTTTLFYLTSLDAQDALTDSKKAIPVHFFLKDFAEKDNLLDKTVKKLTIDKDLVLDMLQKGKINFFFDGLNEVRNTQIAEVNTQISNLLTDYPKNFYIISTRPQSYHRNFDNDFENRKVPVFDLQKLNDSKIIEFLDKNGKQVKAKILETIQNNEAWRKITSNPLMLKMLIVVAVKNEGNVPSETGKIIRAFMDYLYDRERDQRSGNFDKQIFHLLLCHLAYETRSLTNANASLDKDEYILPILKECKSSLQLSEQKTDALAPTDLLDFLRIAVDMNLLTESENQYSFTYELHQLYYYAEYAQKNGKPL